MRLPAVQGRPVPWMLLTFLAACAESGAAPTYERTHSEGDGGPAVAADAWISPEGGSERDAGTDAAPPSEADAATCDPAACDDGNPCTDDRCGMAGCEHVPNGDACDDGIFCNGPDTCAGGSCSVHAGDPCSGGAFCEEAARTCVGCRADRDCPADEVGSWEGCESFSTTCDESGTEEREIRRWACLSGTCRKEVDTESRSCTRETDGLSCGAESCSSWGTCEGFSSTCDETGTQRRTCSVRLCAGGICDLEHYYETRSCARDTDGISCGTDGCSSWGTCGGFSSSCDESGTQTRTCSARLCAGGICDLEHYYENRSCSRDTDGDACNDGSACTYDDRCSWGFCSGTTVNCGPDCRCDSSTGSCEPDTPGAYCLMP